MNMLLVALFGFVLVPVTQDVTPTTPASQDITPTAPIRAESSEQNLINDSHLSYTLKQCEDMLLETYKQYRNKLKKSDQANVASLCTLKSLRTELDSLVHGAFATQEDLQQALEFLNSGAGKRVSDALEKRAKSKHKLRMITPDTQRLLIAKNAKGRSAKYVEELVAKIQVKDSDLLKLCAEADKPYFGVLYSGSLEKEMRNKTKVMVVDCKKACEDSL